MSKGFIFDMNGTMVDDMQYHLSVWHDLINRELMGNFSREEVEQQMYGKNEEVLERMFGPGRFSQQQMDDISIRKEKRYQDVYLPHLKLIDGLPSLLKKAHSQNIPMAIATAAIPFNVDFVVDNLQLRHFFKAIVTADDVRRSKPDPGTFLKAAEDLAVKPTDCIVFEDAPKGVETALNAGMKAIAVTTMHGEAAFSKYDNILFFIKDYTDPRIASLL